MSAQIISFRDDPLLVDYKRAMEDNFPLFRMFLADDVDALITFFISEGSMSVGDMRKIEAGLMQAIKRVATTYPKKVPGSSMDKLKIPRKLLYTCENLNYHVVFNLTNILIHIQASTAALLAFIDKSNK